MNWKSFVIGVVVGVIAIVVLALASVRVYNDIRMDDANVTCEIAIARVEYTSNLSHLSEMEIRACIEAGIEIPPEGR